MLRTVVSKIVKENLDFYRYYWYVIQVGLTYVYCSVEQIIMIY